MALIIGTVNVQLFLEQRSPGQVPPPVEPARVEREVRNGFLEQDAAELERQVRQRDVDRLGGG